MSSDTDCTALYAAMKQATQECRDGTITAACEIFDRGLGKAEFRRQMSDLVDAHDDNIIIRIRSGRINFT